MKEYIRVLTVLLGVLLVSGAMFASIILNFKDTDMTELKLFLTYWKEYIAIFCAIVAGSFLITHKFK